MRHLLVPLAVVALAAGCTPDVAPTSSPSVFVSPTVSASPSVSPSPSPTAVESFPPAPATESAEQAAIRAAWMEYWRVYEKFAADPSLTDLTELQNLTDGEESSAVMSSIQSLREAGRFTKGGWQFREVVVEHPIDGRGEQAKVSYCLDRSRLVIADIATDLPISGPQPGNLMETATLEQGPDGMWRVALRRNQESTC